MRIAQGAYPTGSTYPAKLGIAGYIFTKNGLAPIEKPAKQWNSVSDIK